MDVYLDTAPVIYLVENVAPWEPAVRTFLADATLTPKVSVLTRMECRVLPMRNANEELLKDYEEFFATLPGSALPLDERVFEKATELRARHNFRTPDALHLAAAIVHQCGLFLTNDQRLAKCTEIKIEVLQI